MYCTTNRHFLVILTIFLPIFLNSYTLAIDLEKLESLGISGDFYVSDIAVYFNRAFLAIPRTVCQNNVSHPTLVEVPWKEFNVILKSRMNKPIDGQDWSNCEDLQNAVSLAKEGVKSKLWALDKGNKHCPPKIIAYSMFHNGFLDGEKIKLGKVPRNGLNSMVIENGTKLGEHRAFIANAGDNNILVCNLKDLVCNHLTLLEKGDPSIVVRVDYLSISKVDSTMYLTSMDSLDVFSLEMEGLAAQDEIKNGNDLTANVISCGEKLGPSSGLETDFKNGLIYYLTRDNAVVRWNTEKPMQAEYHDILAQSFKRMPYVSKLFTDPQGSVYALVNPFSPTTCLSEDSVISSKNGSDIIVDGETAVLERVVKIMKYNRLLDIFF